MNSVDPDAIIRVRFLSEMEGGRKTPIMMGDVRYGCPLWAQGMYFDCRFVSADASVLVPGGTYDVAIRFMNPKEALSTITPGADVHLWEGRVIAVGKVIEWRGGPVGPVEGE